MLVLYSALQISKSLILSEAEILVWAHLQGRRVWLAVESVWDLGQRYFHIFVVQMMYAVVWKQYFSLINHISENGNHMTSRKLMYENEDRNYGKLASAKSFIGPRNAIRKKRFLMKNFTEFMSLFDAVFLIRDLYKLLV